jgi:integrase
MKSRSSKAKRIEVKEGNISIPIYRFSDGRYCLDTKLGSKRKRITRFSLESAKLEARRVLTLIAAGRQGENILSLSEVEDYRIAMQRLSGRNVSLLTVVDDWLQSKAREVSLIPKTIPEIVQLLLTKKQAEGASARHIHDRKVRWGRFARDFTGRIDQLTAADIENWLSSLHVASRTKKNYRDAVQQLFRFAKSQNYLTKHEPLVTDDVARIRVKEGEIHIYSPDELRILLLHAPLDLMPFIVLGAFAGLRTQEIFRLAWSDIRFSQGVIEVSASKAKTASRRLTPIHPTLRKWLMLSRMSTGPILDFPSYDAFEKARTRFYNSKILKRQDTCKFVWKHNALRHSYASYRLAKIKNAAEVALEMGNSPSMLFRNYRELVTEQAADEWFSILPAKS